MRKSTLTNGTTKYTGDLERDQYGGGASARGALLTNCYVFKNWAQFGGGVYGGTLASCKVSGNQSGYHGAGLYRGVATACEMTANRADFYGGGTAESVLEKCRVTGNFAHERGGGAYDSTLRNCVISSNEAPGGEDGYGGGAYGSILIDCLVLGNSADAAGGVRDCNVANCTITRNTADWGEGGAFGVNKIFTNSIVYGNQAPHYPEYYLIDFAYSCTTPDPGGEGNITDDPQFIDPDAGDFRLATNSPCINAGTNGVVEPGETDLDGLSRIIGGRVDMGAYESTNGWTAHGVPWGWLLHYGQATDGSADGLDPDGDGSVNADEYGADTAPTDPESVLTFLRIGMVPPYNGIRLDWKGGRDAWQILECKPDLANPNADWEPLLGIPPPTPVTNAVIDLGATNRILYYRLRVERE